MYIKRGRKIKCFGFLSRLVTIPTVTLPLPSGVSLVPPFLISFFHLCRLTLCFLLAFLSPPFLFLAPFSSPYLFCLIPFILLSVLLSSSTTFTLFFYILFSSLLFSLPHPLASPSLPFLLPSTSSFLSRTQLRDGTDMGHRQGNRQRWPANPCACVCVCVMQYQSQPRARLGGCFVPQKRLNKEKCTYCHCGSIVWKTFLLRESRRRYWCSKCYSIAWSESRRVFSYTEWKLTPRWHPFHSLILDCGEKLGPKTGTLMICE